MPHPSAYIRCRFIAGHILAGVWLGLAVAAVFLVANDFRVLKMVAFSAKPAATLFTVIMIPTCLFAIGSALSAVALQICCGQPAPAEGRIRR